MTTENDTTPDTISGHADAAEDIVFGDTPADPAPVKKDAPAADPVTPAPGLPNPDAILKGTPEPAKEPAAPEPDEIDKIAEPAKLSDDGKRGWSELKAKAKTYQAQAAELSAKLEKIEKGEVTAATSARIKELETQLTEAQQRLTQIDVRHSPEFRAKYEVPVDKAIAEMQDLAKEFDVDVSEVDFKQFRNMTLKQAAEKIRELAAGDDILQSELIRRANDIRRLVKEADGVVANAGDFAKQSAEQRQASLRATFDRVSTEFGENFKPVAVPDTASDAEKAEALAYNEDLGRMRATAERIALGQTSPEEVARVAHEAAQFRFMVQRGLPRIGKVYTDLYNQVVAEKNQLAAELAKVTKAKPVVDGRAPTDQQRGYSEMTAEEAAKELVFA